jgi:flagellin
MSDIPLSKPGRPNFASLRNALTAPQPQDRAVAAAGANSSIDNSSSAVTASALNSRAGDLNLLMDSMASGIKTIEQADNGLAAIARNLEAMLSVLRQASEESSTENRAALVELFNKLRDELDGMAESAAFNGVNLLAGDNLTIAFNETGTASIDIQTKDGASISSAHLGLDAPLLAADLDSDEIVAAKLGDIELALSVVRSQSSAFGSNLTMVQSRSDFTRSMINTLETGAAKLVLNDSNEEAANLLALQTRQSLSALNLSMASQSDQSVLQLLR